jgi:hypothetical protein
MLVPRHPNGLQAAMGLPPREARNQSNTVTICSVSPSIINVGHWINQPPASVQSDGRTPGIVRLLSVAHSREQR